MKIVLVSAFMIILWGCGKEQPKIDIPENLEVTKLSDILKSPAEYQGKRVLLSGIASYVCPSGCYMVYQEGSQSIEIYPKGFKFPRLKKGTPVKIYSEITAGKERVIITVLKLEEIK